MVEVLTMRLSKTPMFRVDDWEDGVLVQLSANGRDQKEGKGKLGKTGQIRVFDRFRLER